MTDFSIFIVPTLVWGSAQLLFLGGILLFFDRPITRLVSPANYCVLVPIVFLVAILPETVLHERSVFSFWGRSYQSVLSDLFLVMTIAWLLGMVISTTIVVRQVFKNHRSLIRIPMVTQPELLDVIEEIKTRLKLWVPVTLYRSAQVSSPMLYGWVRPRIFLPDDEGDSAGHTQYILAHECMHVRRRDILWQWLALTCALLFWFHPVAWMLLRRLKDHRELACDQAVIDELGYDHESYALALLAEARRVNRPEGDFNAPVHAGIVEKPTLIENRIQSIMKPSSPTARRHFVTVLLCGLALTTSVLVAQTQPEPRPAVTEAEKRVIEKRAGTILEAIWSKKDVMAGYEYASTFYKSQVSEDKYQETMESPMVAAITVVSRELSNVSELTGPQAVEGGTNVIFEFETKIEGTADVFKETLAMIEEDGEWLFTGHFILLK